MADFLIKENGQGVKVISRNADRSYLPNNDVIEAEWLGLPEVKDTNGVYHRLSPQGMSKSVFYNLPEQMRFFDKRMKKFEKQNRKSNRVVFLITLGSILLCILSVVLIIISNFAYKKEAIFCISLANIYLSSISLNMYEGLASKYSYCKLLVQRAVQDYFADPSRAKRIFKQFGVETIEENAEWLIIQKNR